MVSLNKIKEFNSTLPAFSISHSSVIHREICIKTGTAVPRILKFGTNVGFDLYCAKESQHAAAYHSLYLSIFLPLQ